MEININILQFVLQVIVIVIALKLADLTLQYFEKRLERKKEKELEEYIKLKSQELIDYIHEFSFQFGILYNTQLTHEEKMLRISEKLKLPEEVVYDIFRVDSNNKK